jgi:hypothetical protein
MKITSAPVQPTPAPARRTSEDIAASAQINLDAFKNNDVPLEQEFSRVPFGQAGLQLHATSIPGYHLHWINDWHPAMTDRLHQCLKAGYKFVNQQEAETAQLLGASTTDLSGERVSRSVGTQPNGQPITAYLMKIPTEWWIEHQRPVWERADRVDTAIRRGAEGARVEGGYNPKGDSTKLTTELRKGEIDG